MPTVSSDTIDGLSPVSFDFMTGSLLISEHIILDVDFWNATGTRSVKTASASSLYDQSKSVITCLLTNQKATISGDLVFIQRYQQCIA